MAIRRAGALRAAFTTPSQVAFAGAYIYGDFDLEGDLAACFPVHGIGVPELPALKERPTFTDVYVFPDGELVPIGTVTRAAELEGFEVRDVENLRDHYSLTLGHWVHGLEEHCDEARRLVDEVTYRIRRLYTAGSAYSFRSGKLNLYQTLLVKSVNGKSRLPLTRRDWYLKT